MPTPRPLGRATRRGGVEADGLACSLVQQAVSPTVTCGVDLKLTLVVLDDFRHRIDGASIIVRRPNAFIGERLTGACFLANGPCHC